MPTPGPFAHRIHPRPVTATPLPAKPEDVGCPPSCGLYEPNRHACTPCYLAALEVAERG